MNKQSIVDELKRRNISARVVFKSQKNEAWLYLGHSNLGRLLREETFSNPEYRNTFFSELEGDLKLSLQY